MGPRRFRGPTPFLTVIGPHTPWAARCSAEHDAELVEREQRHGLEQRRHRIGARQRGGQRSERDDRIAALGAQHVGVDDAGAAEAAFYAEAVEKGKLNGIAQTFARVVARHEASHVAALQKALGAKAVSKPNFDFKGTTGDESAFLKTSITLEDTGVSAYQGQADRIKSDQVLASAASILAVEARHAAWVRDIVGAGKGTLPAPAAFNQPQSMSAVLDAVKSTGFITQS